MWLAAPYFSMLLICRSAPLATRVAGRTALTLPVGWVAVLGLFAAIVGMWSPPLPVMVVLAALSGLAMLVAGRDGGDEDDDEDEPGPSVDWDAFDDARRSWERARQPRSPAGVA